MQIDQLVKIITVFIISLFLLMTFQSHAGDFTSIEAWPNTRILYKKTGLTFTWATDLISDTVEIKLFKKTSSNQEILRDTASVPSNRKSLSGFGGILEPGNYRWIIAGYAQSKASPVFSESINFTIESPRPMNSNLTKIGAFLGYSQGNYSSNSPENITLAYSTNQTLYGLFVETPALNPFLIKGSAHYQDSVVMGAHSQILTVNADLTFPIFFLKQRLSLALGTRFSYLLIPEIQYKLNDTQTETSIASGSTKGILLGPLMELSFAWSAQLYSTLNFALNIPHSSSDTLWALSNNKKTNSIDVNAALRGIWTWPYEVGFLLGYRNITLTQSQGTSINSTQITDIRFSAQIAYLFSTF